MRFKKPTLSGKALDWEPLKFEPNRLIGAFIFGAGWALAGACPGTVLTQLGEGKVSAIFTVVGIFLWVFGPFKNGSLKLPAKTFVTKFVWVRFPLGFYSRKWSCSSSRTRLAITG